MILVKIVQHNKINEIRIIFDMTNQNFNQLKVHFRTKPITNMITVKNKT